MRINRCFNCDCQMEQTGRLTWYCPDCDVCPDCGCPRADGFAHYQGCESADLCDGCGEEPVNCECPPWLHWSGLAFRIKDAQKTPRHHLPTEHASYQNEIQVQRRLQFR